MNAPQAPSPSPSSLPRFWSGLTTRDFASLDPAATVAVLPLGATEQHGPHLPLAVDTVLADRVHHSDRQALLSAARTVGANVVEADLAATAPAAPGAHDPARLAEAFGTVLA